MPASTIITLFEKNQKEEILLLGSVCDVVPFVPHYKSKERACQQAGGPTARYINSAKAIHREDTDIWKTDIFDPGM
jgi:hypothetical protein